MVPSIVIAPASETRFMAAKETEFSKVRFWWHNAKAAKVDSLGAGRVDGFLNIVSPERLNWFDGQVYENIVPLVAEDIADQIIYVTTRPRVNLLVLQFVNKAVEKLKVLLATLRHVQNCWHHFICYKSGGSGVVWGMSWDCWFHWWASKSVILS